jgi:hypothetical protein
LCHILEIDPNMKWTSWYQVTGIYQTEVVTELRVVQI